MIRLIDLLNESIIEKSTSVPTIIDMLPIINKMGSKTMLTREFKGIRTGAAKIKSGPIDKGRIGTAINPNSPGYLKDIADVFNSVINKFNLKHIIYCSHGSVRFHLAGPQYFMIPIGKYKTIWSDNIKDIYSDAMGLKKSGKLHEFPIKSYKNTWPSGDVNEVLVDCNEYYLISINIPIIQEYMKRNKVQSPKTYNQLYTILDGSIQPYKNLY